jgi:3'(2'), 5'-bisphosphate nucleotidase
MKDNLKLYAQELKVAQDLAREAGALLLDYYEQGVAVEQKIAEDHYHEPVTIADRASNELIVNGLLASFPADGILAEESTDDYERLSKPRVWMIDPVDGTSGFIDHDDDFAVQIGLTVEGEAVLGVVYQPVPDALFWAVRGAGAWAERGGPPERVEVAKEAKLSQMTLAVSRSHRSPRMDTVVRAYGFAQEVRRGSVGIKIGLIADQLAHLYIHLSPRTKQWDTCAPEVILTEAGGVLTDLFGQPLRYNTREVQNLNGLIASNSVIHSELVARMQPLLQGFGREHRAIE